jgi:tRNA(fMet)-specific endonuclease VapC
MDAQYLLDTNIIIYVRRRRPPEVLSRFAKLKLGEAVLSVITYGELFYGLEKGRSGRDGMQQLEEMTSFLPVLPLPAEAAKAYGRIRAALEADGQIIGHNDLWIAAHAYAAGLTLVTNNEREFRRVPGLRIENWVG